jgi:hypothetical protein
MPSFIYPSLSLASHEVIMVLYSLQLFVCPVNDNMTYVPCLASNGVGDLQHIHDPHDLSSS